MFSDLDCLGLIFPEVLEGDKGGEGLIEGKRCDYFLKGDVCLILWIVISGIGVIL